MEKYIHLRIPELLKEKGISKTKLCKALDLQRTNLNKYCRDDFKRIDATLLIKLCDYSQCEISDLLEIKELNDSKEIKQSPKLLHPVYKNSVSKC